MKRVIIIGIIILVISVPSAAIAQVFGGKKLTPESLRQNLSDTQSFISEEIFMLTLFQKGKISNTYLARQTEQITNKVMDFYSNYSDAAVSIPESNLVSSEKLIFSVSKTLKQIVIKNREKRQLAEIKKTLINLRANIQKEEKKYE